MLYKTRAISLSFIKYKESSIIARCYTEEFGLQSYIVNGVRSAKGKTKIALFQPLTLLDLVVYYKKEKNLHRISEMKCSEVLHHIPFEMKKSSIALFINEVLNKILVEESENETLFSFLHDSILILDYLSKNDENFHLQFLFRLTSYLGLAPGTADNMLDQISIYDRITPDEMRRLEEIVNSKYGDDLPQLTHLHRNQILKHLLDFYSHHFDNMHYNEFKSLPVLREILS